MFLRSTPKLFGTVKCAQASRIGRWTSACLLAFLFLSGCQPVQAPEVAPDVDRVGFPENYQTDYTLFYRFDRPDNKTARVVYANAQAASVAPGGAFSYGSVLVMEVYRTPKDETGRVLLDEQGAYLHDELAGIFVMRKEPGFGKKYGDVRSGEWEYVAYQADGSFATSPERTNGCATCHMEAGQGKDWVFGTHRYVGTEPPIPAENTVMVLDYSLMPSTITVTVGTEVTWANHDVVLHTITSEAFNSGALRIQANYRHKFEEPGEYDYFCAVHPAMTGKVVVTE